MSWSLVFSDNFTRANGAVGNGWTDVNSVWSIVSNTLHSTSSNYTTDLLYRPAGESAGDQQVVMQFTADTTRTSPIAWVRGSAGSRNGYVAWAGTPDGGASSVIQIGKMSGGTLGSVGQSSCSCAPGTQYILTLNVVGNLVSASIAAASAPSTVLGSITLTDSSYATGVCIISPLTSSTNVVESIQTYIGAVSSGTATFASATNTTVNVSVGAASGTAPITYQWYRSTSANFTPGAGNIMSGATATTFSDSTAVANTIYYYKCVATDAVPSTAASNEIIGSLWLAPLKLGFIGDSITTGFGATTSAPTNCGNNDLVKIRNQRQVIVTNQGVSGTTTADWLPGAGSGDLTSAKSAFASAGVTHVAIMLGTNDAKDANSVSAASYGSNLSSIASNLVAAGYTVILNYPPYVVPGSGTNAWTAAANGLLESYGAQINSLVNGTTILQGDKLAFQYFGEHTSELGDGVHPNDTGSLSLGHLWASAIDLALNPATGGGTSAARIMGGL